MEHERKVMPSYLTQLIARVHAVVVWFRAFCRGWFVTVDDVLKYVDEQPGISGREIRRRLRDDGLIVSAPSFYAMMASAEDAGKVRGENASRWASGHRLTPRHYWLPASFEHKTR